MEKLSKIQLDTVLLLLIMGLYILTFYMYINKFDNIFKEIIENSNKIKQEILIQENQNELLSPDLEALRKRDKFLEEKDD